MGDITIYEISLWERDYVWRLMEGGPTPEEAKENYNTGSHDYSKDAADAADDELSYMAQE